MAQSAHLTKCALSEWEEARRYWDKVHYLWNSKTGFFFPEKVTQLADKPKKWAKILGAVAPEKAGEMLPAGRIKFVKLAARRCLSQLLDLSLILACISLGCRPKEFAHAFLDL